MPDPNNVILRDLGICLALPCRAANTSIKLGLAHHLGLKLPKPDDPPQFGVHNAEGLFDYVALKDVPKSYTVIGVLRRPLDRIVSSWQFTAAPHQDFPAWARRMAQHSDHDANQHVRSQSYDMMVDGVWRPKYMLYVDEHLDDDWRDFEIAVLQELDHWPLPRANTLEENNCVRREPTFTAETWKIVYSRWVADFLAYDMYEPRRMTRMFGRSPRLRPRPRPPRGSQAAAASGG